MRASERTSFRAFVAPYRFSRRPPLHTMHTRVHEVSLPLTTGFSLSPPSLSFSRSTLRDLAKYVAWVEDGEEGRRNEGCYRGGRDLDPSYGEKGRKSIDLETMWKREAKATTRWIRLCDKCEKRRGSPDLHATGRGRGRVFKVP